jgi:hypothetical protein
MSEKKEAKRVKRKKNNIIMINNMRKNLNGSKRRSWEKYGS